MKKFSFTQKTVCTMALLGFLQFAALSSAQAQENTWYLSGAIGASLAASLPFDVVDSPFDRGGNAKLSNPDNKPFARVGAGLHLDKNFRIEGSVFWLPFSIDEADYEYITLPGFAGVDPNDVVSASGAINTTGGTINVYYDFDTGTVWTPYVGVGYGVAKVVLEADVTILGQTGSAEEEEYVQLGETEIGLGYDANERINIFTNYRRSFYNAMSFEQESGSSINTKTFNHGQLESGVRIKVGR